MPSRPYAGRTIELQPGVRHLLTAIVGALMVSAALCFSPVGGDTSHREIGIAMAMEWGGSHTEDRAPQHHGHGHGHGHGAGCTSPGLTPQASVTAQHSEPGATPLTLPMGSDATALEAPISRAVASSGASLARSGRSLQISVCRWRI
ncbi:hypothetical protein ACFT7S_38400 [Streptomyces sp. NPDC057136]|uniref:hypothetical protein n=1 Tax=Streptomyces sp. NPDC057136 TaxID=3346029 RepID=UPI00363C6814